MNIDHLISSSRPAESSGWSQTTEGNAVLTTILDRSRESEAGRRRLPRKRLIVGMAVAVVLGSTGAATAYAIIGEPPAKWRANGQVACGDELSASSSLAIFKVPARMNALDACRAYWRDEAKKPAPEPLIACVFAKGGEGGGMAVLPGRKGSTAEKDCNSIGMFVAPDEAIATP
ncbi:hypothetical protein [Actinoplanes sp. NPDC051859]|uniref:hypothetical protein n=1 Tax=Actinoplanes sp. NPDC051859 TaxID=3363909 RepID=UPI0037898B8F